MNKIKVIPFKFGGDHGSQVWVDLGEVRNLELEGSYSDVHWEYYYYFLDILDAYLNSTRTIAKYKASVKNLIKEYFPQAFALGWRDGGGDPGEIDNDSLTWLEVRIDAELGYVDVLFDAAKRLRESEEKDEFGEFLAQKAEGYTNTLDGIYNEGLMRAGKDIALTFVGDDGVESCKTCMKWKNKRHRKSFWVKRGLVPGQPGNPNFECRGYNCMHYLVDDNGKRYTF